MTKNGLYATPPPLPKIEDCYFYQTIDLPGVGTVKGSWDLRQEIDGYLGHLSLAGKRFLDVGTGTGFVAFEAERRGAEVVAFDLSTSEPWDYVPYHEKLAQEAFGCSIEFLVNDKRRVVGNLHRSFWFAHHHLKSRVAVCYGNAYAIPPEIGPVDVSFFGSILLHMRNPLAAIESAARLTRETISIAEAMHFPLDYNLPQMLLLPKVEKPLILDTWWQLTPPLISNFLQILGFSRTSVVYHTQIFCDVGNARVPCFTVVGHRA